MPIEHETELYIPVKRFFEKQGFEVRGEVRNCDLVAVRGDEEPVIVELKKTLNLPLLVQGIERLASSGRVYLAVEQNRNGRAPHNLKWNDLIRLCRMLGLGLITVRFYKTKSPFVEILCDHSPYTPRKTVRRTKSLLAEFRERSGDYNTGGSSKRKLVTAYREKALHCAYAMKRYGPLSTKQLREITGSSKAASILQKNFYGWYRRVERGTYDITPTGEQALEAFCDVVKLWDRE